jgi:hypothetical protein
MNTKTAKWIIAAVVAMSLAGNSVMAQQAGAGKPPGNYKAPIKVFVLAGQSNMEGHGVVSMDGDADYNGGRGNRHGLRPLPASGEACRQHRGHREARRAAGPQLSGTHSRKEGKLAMNAKAFRRSRCYLWYSGVMQIFQ